PRQAGAWFRLAGRRGSAAPRLCKMQLQGLRRPFLERWEEGWRRGTAVSRHVLPCRIQRYQRYAATRRWRYRACHATEALRAPVQAARCSSRAQGCRGSSSKSVLDREGFHQLWLEPIQGPAKRMLSSLALA